MGRNKKNKNRNRAKNPQKQKKTKAQHKDSKSSQDFHILSNIYHKTRDLEQTSETEQDSSIEYERRRQKRILKYNKNNDANHLSEISSSEYGNSRRLNSREVSTENEPLLLPTDQSKPYIIFQEDFQQENYPSRHGRSNVTVNDRKKGLAKQITHSYNKNTQNLHNNQPNKRNLFNLNESSIHPDKVMRQNVRNFEEFEANHQEESPLISNKKPYNKSNYVHKKIKQQRRNDNSKTQKFNKSYRFSARTPNQEKRSRKNILTSLNQRNATDKNHRHYIEETEEEPSSDPQHSQYNKSLPKHANISRHSKQPNSYCKQTPNPKDKNQKYKMNATQNQNRLKSNSKPMNKQNQDQNIPEIIHPELSGPPSSWKSQIHQTPDVLGLCGLEYSNHPQIMAEKYLQKQNQSKPTSFLKRHKSFIWMVVVFLILFFIQKIPEISSLNTSLFKTPDYLKKYIQLVTNSDENNKEYPSEDSEMAIMLRKIEELQTLTEENRIQNELYVSNLEIKMSEKLRICKKERTDLEEELEVTKARIDRLEKNFESFKTNISKNSNKHKEMIRKLIEMNQQVVLSQVHIYVYVCAYFIQIILNNDVFFLNENDNLIKLMLTERIFQKSGEQGVSVWNMRLSVGFIWKSQDYLFQIGQTQIDLLCLLL